VPYETAAAGERASPKLTPATHSHDHRVSFGRIEGIATACTCFLLHRSKSHCEHSMNMQES
jgi:hypothetical protein